MFETEEDYDLCAEACNGQEAVDLARQHKPELIVLDLSMPIMDGLQAARILKKIMPEVPIILFTQHVDSSALKFVDLPVDRVVSKSEGSTLISHIRTLIPI
jgi:DNA-binding NarL/FixJ family response regulator